MFTKGFKILLQKKNSSTITEQFYNVYNEPRLQLANYLKHDNFGDVGTYILTTLRASCSMLSVDTGRTTKPFTPHHLRTCKFCNKNLVEDAYHIYFDCTFNPAIKYRQQLFKNLPHNVMQFADNKKELLNILLCKNVKNVTNKKLINLLKIFWIQTYASRDYDVQLFKYKSLK